MLAPLSRSVAVLAYFTASSMLLITIMDNIILVCAMIVVYGLCAFFVHNGLMRNRFYLREFFLSQAIMYSGVFFRENYQWVGVALAFLALALWTYAALFAPSKSPAASSAEHEGED